MEKSTLNIIIGLIVVAVSILAFVFPNSIYWVAVILLCVLILIIGFSRIFDGIKEDDPDKKSHKFLNIAAGILVILLAVIVMSLALVDQTITSIFLLILFAVIFLVLGIARIFAGIRFKLFAKWVRIVDIIFGIAILILAILMFFNLDADGATKVFLLALTMLLSGTIRIINGIFGKPVEPKEEAAPEPAE